MQFFVALAAIIVLIVMFIRGHLKEAEAQRALQNIRKQQRDLIDTMTNRALEQEALQMARKSVLDNKKLPEVEEVCEEIGIPYPDNVKQAVQILLGRRGFVPIREIGNLTWYWAPNSSQRNPFWDAKIDMVETRRIQKKFFIWLNDQMKKRCVGYKIYAMGSFRAFSQSRFGDAYTEVDTPGQLATFYEWNVFMSDRIPRVAEIDKNCPCCDPDYK